MKETKSQKVKGTKSQRNKERKRRREELSLEGCTPAKMAAGAAAPKAQFILMKRAESPTKPDKGGFATSPGQVSEANDTLGRRPYHVSRPARAKA